MLPTDWGAPGASALSRLHDGRVRQFWDPNHAVSSVLKKVEQSGGLHPSCCNRKGVLWDLIAAYAPGAMWREMLPQPVLFDGTVVRTTPQLDSLLAKK